MNILSCLKNFITIADYSSFSKAANKNYASPAKLSKQISWLEDELKIKLFIRSTRKLTLTEPGQRLYEKALKLLEDLEQIKSIAHPEKLAPQGMIQLYLMAAPAIPYFTSLSVMFMQKYPKVEIDLKVSESIESLPTSQFDLAISFEDIKHPKWICKKMFSIQRGIYATPSYFRKFGKPKKPEDLIKHNCLINTLYGLQNKWIINEEIIHVTGNFKSNNAAVLKQAALNNLGLIWVPPFTVNEEVMRKQLIRALPKMISPAISLYAICPNHITDTNKINLLIKFFQRHALKDNVSMLID